MPYAIDTPVGGSHLVLNRALQVTGTAIATINLGLSFDTALTDSDRISLVESGSLLSLSFDGVTATPITAMAALGLISVQVNGGSLSVGALSNGVVNSADPATATMGLVSASSGRVTLAQLAASPIGEAFGLSAVDDVSLGLSGGILGLTLNVTPTLASADVPMNFDFATLGVGAQPVDDATRADPAG